MGRYGVMSFNLPVASFSLPGMNFRFVLFSPHPSQRSPLATSWAALHIRAPLMMQRSQFSEESKH